LVRWRGRWPRCSGDGRGGRGAGSGVYGPPPRRTTRLRTTHSGASVTSPSGEPNGTPGRYRQSGESDKVATSVLPVLSFSLGSPSFMRLSRLVPVLAAGALFAASTSPAQAQTDPVEGVGTTVGALSLLGLDAADLL